MEEPIFVTKKYNASTIMSIVSGCILLFIAFIFFLEHVVNSLDIDITLISTALCVLFASFQFLSLFLTPAIYSVYNDYMTIQTFFGQQKNIIYISQIKKWTESWSQYRFGSIYYYTLKIYTDTKSFKIRSASLDTNDYKTLKELLTKNIPQGIRIGDPYNAKRSNTTVIIVFGILIAFAILFILFTANSKQS